MNILRGFVYVAVLVAALIFINQNVTCYDFFGVVKGCNIKAP